MKKTFFAIIFGCCVSVSAQSGNYGERSGTITNHLNDTVWSMSEWISVIDAPVVTGKIKDGMRAADGANWFATTIRNDKAVSSAKMDDHSFGYI